MSENNNRSSIEDMVASTSKDKNQRERTQWRGFVESDVANFMQLNEIEKMTLDDGMGNKAKLTKRKDGSIFVETTSSSVL